MRVEGFAEIVRQVAHYLHPPKPMEKKQCSGTGVYRPGRGRCRPHSRRTQLRSRRTPTSTARKKNNGQAIGWTRGDWNTKIHVVAASDTVIAGVRRERAGRECGAVVAGNARPTGDDRRSCDGLGLFRRPYADDRMVAKVQPRSSAKTEPQETLGSRYGSVQETQRGGAFFQAVKNIPCRCHQIRQT